DPPQRILSRNAGSGVVVAGAGTAAGGEVVGGEHEGGFGVRGPPVGPGSGAAADLDERQRQEGGTVGDFELGGDLVVTGEPGEELIRDGVEGFVGDQRVFSDELA